MTNFKHLYFLALILFYSISLTAQEQHEWHPVQIDKLGLKASFYETPVANTQQDGKETIYTFENKITEKEHPNKSYLISIYITSDSTDANYAKNKEEELSTRKIHGSSLQLVSKSTITRGGYNLDYYQLKNNKDEFTHYCIGTINGKVYSLEVQCKKDEPFNAELLHFLRNFMVFDPVNMSFEIKIKDLSYTIRFPYQPTIKRINTPEPHILYQTIASAKAPEEEVEVMAFFGDKEEKIKVLQCTDSIYQYQVTETVFIDEIPLEKYQENTDEIFQEIIHSLVSHTNGKLIETHEIKKGSFKGKALTIRTIEDRTQHYQLFLINRTLYTIEVELAYRVRNLCGSAILFFNSFQPK